jgi:hypothetical protein
MNKIKHFRARMAACLGFLLVMLVCSRAELSAVQLGCWGVILLAGLALLVINQRNEVFHNAAYIPLIVALLVIFWVSRPLDSRQIVINIFLSFFFGWLTVRPYYIQWKKSRSPAVRISESSLN